MYVGYGLYVVVFVFGDWLVVVWIDLFLVGIVIGIVEVVCVFGVMLVEGIECVEC